MSAVIGKVKLKFSSSFATMLNVKPTSLIGLEYDIKDGATVGSVFQELVRNYPSLRIYLFNPDNTGVSERLDVVLNNTLLKGKDVAATGIKDGDTLVLLPVYEGG